MGALGHSDCGTSIAALGKELKMGKSTTHRLLATLREFDLVWFDPGTSTYTLGARISTLERSPGTAEPGYASWLADSP
jgi:DNA-binding IclR family transcriptional regulator